MPKPPRPSAEQRSSQQEDPEIIRAQAKLITSRRIMGASLAKIGEEFQMSEATVKRRIEWAKRHGLVEDALDNVLTKLVPEALKTYLLAIQQGDVDAARDVLFGTGVLQKTPQFGRTPTQSVEMTIETYREQRSNANQPINGNDAPMLPSNQARSRDLASKFTRKQLATDRIINHLAGLEAPSAEAFTPSLGESSGEGSSEGDEPFADPLEDGPEDS